MKRLYRAIDWLILLTVGACAGWLGAYLEYDKRAAQIEQSMCNTAYLLTRKSSDTIALVARQHACVLQLSSSNTRDPFPYDTLFPDAPTK